MNKQKKSVDSKHKIQRIKKIETSNQQVGLSKMGLKVIFSSMGLLIVGFILLRFTNPSGNNWASFISPLVIILAYIFIGIGIMIK